MALLTHFQEVLPLDIHYVFYENLVENLEFEIRKLIDFLGLEWEEDILHYKEKAKGRYISTASYHQAIKPIYKSSSGRWQNYREQLSPILPALAPFIEMIGQARTNEASGG